MKKEYRLTEDQLAMRVAQEFQDGDCVNIGAGAPFLVSQYVSRDKFVLFQIEHGILGIGKVAEGDEIDQDLVGLGRRPLTAVPGASCFSSAEAFAMLRGGHIGYSILGAYQVSEKGDIANWVLPGGLAHVGGAMDIVGHVRKLFVMMTHVTKEGKPKIVRRCTLPVTEIECVDMIFTDMAVIEVTQGGLVLKEVARGFTAEDVQKATEPKLIVSHELKEIEI